MTTTTNAKNQIDFTRINNDVNGNPRFVCHFLAFINEGDKTKADRRGMGSISEQYVIALNKARQLGGRKFHNKQYGGGIVFQMYDGQRDEMSERIAEIKKVNTNFLNGWTPKQFKQVEKAILNHFQVYTYKFQSSHDAGSQKPFQPYNYDQISDLLGLAYTSGSDYAAFWVCNSGYMMANDTHHFHSFAINTDGKVIGIAQDENENEIFIEL